MITQFYLMALFRLVTAAAKLAESFSYWLAAPRETTTSVLKSCIFCKSSINFSPAFSKAKCRGTKDTGTLIFNIAAILALVWVIIGVSLSKAAGLTVPSSGANSCKIVLTSSPLTGYFL